MDYSTGKVIADLAQSVLNRQARMMTDKFELLDEPDHVRALAISVAAGTLVHVMEFYQSGPHPIFNALTPEMRISVMLAIVSKALGVGGSIEGMNPQDLTDMAAATRECWVPVQVIMREFP